jgi:hypothetical protein
MGLNQVIILARNFLIEACEALNIKMDDIPLIFRPIPECKFLGLPIPYMINKNNEFTINTTFLDILIKSGKYTVLRGIMYIYARLIYLRKKDYNLDIFDNEVISDAVAFSLSMLLIKGEPVPADIIPNNFIPLKVLFSDKIVSKIIPIVKEVWNLDCSLNREFNVIAPQKDSYILRIKNMKSVVGQMSICENVIKEPVISNGEKGSQKNPFDTIYEARDYILKKEKEAYKKDSFLNKISQEQYFFDPSIERFKVAWARPYVTFYENDFPNNAYIVNQLFSGRFSLKPNLYGRKFLYRGQSQYYSPSYPSLFRDYTKNYFLDDLIWDQEMMLMIKSHPLVRLLDKGVEIKHDIFRFEINYGGLCQHYYNKTTYMDITSDMDAAMFFATSNYNSKKDIYEPAINTQKPGVLYYYELCMPLAFQKRKDFALSTIGKQVFMRSGSQHGFLLDMKRDLDFNTIPYVHKVFFKQNDAITQKIFDKSKGGKKFFPSDILEMAWKEKIRQNLKEKKVSYKTVKYNVSQNKGETFESIENRLQKKGITVDRSYIPSFTPEQIETYYKEVRENNFWEDFCHDIYFYGADGDLYKEGLLNLPNRKEYQWAFRQVKKNKE